MTQKRFFDKLDDFFRSRFLIKLPLKLIKQVIHL